MLQVLLKRSTSFALKQPLCVVSVRYDIVLRNAHHAANCIRRSRLSSFFFLFPHSVNRKRVIFDGLDLLKLKCFVTPFQILYIVYCILSPDIALYASFIYLAERPVSV